MAEIEKEVLNDEDVKKSAAETKQLDEEIGERSRVDYIKKKFSNSKRKHAFGEKSENVYKMKSELRCEGIFTKGVKTCYKSFDTAHSNCHSYLPVIGYLLCWPMKLTFICDLASSYMGKRTCNSDVVFNSGFGESMDTAEEVQREFNKAFSVSVQYKIDIPEEKIDQIYAQEITQSIEHEFNRRKRSLQFCLNMINRIMAFMFIQVFNVSRKYSEQYSRKIQFDNKYITAYFRHIEARRRLQGKATLFPLKKNERLVLRERMKLKFSAEEKALFVGNVLRMIAELVSVSIILLFDRIFYEFLMLIQRHADITYYQTGHHHIKLEVFGDGFLGKLVKSIIKGFNKVHAIDQITSTAECLPQPRKLADEWTTQIGVLFFLLFISMLFQSYVLRIRSLICAFFYPKREKARILFLYNDYLKKRKSYIKFMKRHVRKMAKKQAIALDTGVLFSLRHMYPKCFGWVQKVGLGKRRCIICEETETRKVAFIVCSKECPFCYCPECWKDVKEKCYVCLQNNEEDSDHSDDISEPDTE